ncbi:MAG TPA: hypothetical protein VHL79_15875 [Ramlibacter sp.]|jgi:hypothetical protein|nr:hypothetical protein [Ramlibacter sp.]
MHRDSSASHSPARNAIVFHLLAELESYGSQVGQLASDWDRTRDLVLFGAVGRSMDRMRSLVGSLPDLSAPWVMTLISHTELMHNLWRVTKGESLDVVRELADHLACVEAMACRCRHLLLQGGAVLH